VDDMLIVALAISTIRRDLNRYLKNFRLNPADYGLQAGAAQA
jgi:hypothetical protein